MLVSNDFANLPLWLCKWYLSIVVVLNSFLKHMPKYSKTNSVTLKFKEPSNICSYHLGGRVYIHFLPREITTSLWIPITFNCRTKPNQPKCKIANSTRNLLSCWIGDILSTLDITYLIQSTTTSSHSYHIPKSLFTMGGCALHNSF
jgi:hypothetical protein